MATAILSRAEAVSQVKNVQREFKEVQFLATKRAILCLAVVLFFVFIEKLSTDKPMDRQNRLHYPCCACVHGVITS